MPPTRKLLIEKHSVQSHCKKQQLSQAVHWCNRGYHKKGIYNHKLSFSNRNYSTNTSLFTHVWHLKDMNISLTITREILKLAPTYCKTSKICLLCHYEKQAIITHPSQNTLLIKKYEVLTKCRHENKHLLSHFIQYTSPIHHTYSTSIAKIPHSPSQITPQHT